ncbi:MAG TPA: hypothetical protein VLG47_01700 [Candidatus Saccharimonadales bacterium]|nr:hypothetical protein [Candidatus Saccharimonadales bacterium]
MVVHILVAFGGLISSAAALLSPSKTKIRLTYGFAAMIVASGTILVIQSHAAILPSCITGLGFVGVVLAGAVAAQRRLAHQETDN